jgi:PIN domain-containing protein
MKVVLDTNVLVSGLLQPYSHPGQILRMVAGGTISLGYDARVLGEPSKSPRQMQIAPCTAGLPGCRIPTLGNIAIDASAS